MRLLGAVLAGGQSRRFGGDKAAATLDGVTLLDRAIAALRPQVAAVVIAGREHADPPGIGDRPAGGHGPLAGLNAALHYGAAHGFDAVVSVPCDTPFLPPDLAARLIAAGLPACVPALPVVGLWPVALAPLLDRHLAASDDRSMRGWVRACGAQPCDLGPIANVNRPADLAALNA